MWFWAKKVKAYWWTAVPNFGDALAPLLLERFAEAKVEWSKICGAQVASIGSILEHVPPLWDGYILGSGKLRESSMLHIHHRDIKILSLRGPLSARGVRGSFTLGDPGLLADELVGPQEKTFDLGIFPHWHDKELVPRFQAILPSTATRTVINAADHPLTVLRQIGSCQRIVTSSLHGMILADAFGLPRRVEMCKQTIKDGGDFKFRDYSASIQLPFQVGVMQEAVRARVEDVRFGIQDAYQTLRSLIK